ncbi:hypothetical protein FOL47_006521 [Perkinsus chesapeaki]|uniref:WW domain-containing protein n=1 Tax=Perkinsus chesapeaki TaxID=330153 RepID=A0A7J6LRB7_PERCH|nr:hypothetical protein FOL47_006521 [Perkinsus chesapeaki]
MASQLQTPSNAFGGGTTSLFDSDKPNNNSIDSQQQQPARWYRYWNEQYNRYFYWQESNSISTWDLPPDGDTVVDYTTKEVVSGPDSTTTAASAAMSPDVWRSATPEQNANQQTYDMPSNQDILDRYDATAASATAALFGPGPTSSSAASVDFDVLARGGGSLQGGAGMPSFDNSVGDSLSWLQKSVSPVAQQQQPNSSSINSQVVDSLFPSLVRTTLDEIDGGGLRQRQQQQQPSGGMFGMSADGYQQAELDREYEERLTEAPLPCEAAQHKQSKKDKKMGRMPKATKPIKLIGGGGPSAWGASPGPSASSMTPRGRERPNSGNAESNAEDELANEMAAHGIVLKKAKMKSHKSGRQQPKAIPVGRK